MVWRAGVGGNPKVVRHCLQIILGQGLRARHQLDVRVPEALGILGALHELGGAAGKLDADERPMPEDVAQAIAELIAHFRDPLVGRAAIGAGVASVFDEGDVSIRGAENVVELFVHRPIEPIAPRQVRHASPSLPIGSPTNVGTVSGATIWINPRPLWARSLTAPAVEE